MIYDGGHILDIWAQVMIGSVRDAGPDLSARQLALMLLVARRAGPHTVKSLSIDLNISKPAITRALHSLGQLGYVQRQHPAHDRRHVHVSLTPAGQAVLAQMAQRFTHAMGRVAA